MTNRRLNSNILAWLLQSSYKTNNGTLIPAGVKDRFMKCLNAPNYTIFSNTTSAQRWNDEIDGGSEPIVPIESPYNAIHLADARQPSRPFCRPRWVGTSDVQGKSPPEPPSVLCPDS